MGLRLNPAEVLSYLNALGYYNITAVQLREFMNDLRKLIKYELRHEQEDIENGLIEPTLNNNKCPTTVFHMAQTESSKAKQNVKKDNIISVEIKRPRHARSTCCFESNFKKCTFSDKNSKIQTKETTSIGRNAEENKSENAQEVKECLSKSNYNLRSKVSFKSNVLKPKASVIIPRQPIKLSKSDPVALYHKYQEGWKRYKVPGEDNHSQLRWAIREKLLGQSRVMSAAPSMEYIARKRRSLNSI